MVGIKRILFGIALILIGISSFNIAQGGYFSIFVVIAYLFPFIGIIFALTGLFKKE